MDIPSMTDPFRHRECSTLVKCFLPNLFSDFFFILYGLKLISCQRNLSNTILFHLWHTLWQNIKTSKGMFKPLNTIQGSFWNNAHFYQTAAVPYYCSVTLNTTFSRQFSTSRTRWMRSTAIYTTILQITWFHGKTTMIQIFPEFKRNKRSVRRRCR